MKKLISISLVLVLAGGLLLAGNKKAEAMTGESAALLTASLILLPVISAITYNHYVPPPVYSNVYYYDSYPVQTRVIYRAPRYGRHYERHYGQYWGYERGWRENRGHRGYSRGYDYARGRH
jgi:hypothetical protein